MPLAYLKKFFMTGPLQWQHRTKKIRTCIGNKTPYFRSYHNVKHAADVTQACFVILKHCQPEQFPEIELLAFFVAALAHDVGHPGRNNAFMMNTLNEIALLYNGISVVFCFAMF